MFGGLGASDFGRLGAAGGAGVGSVSPSTSGGSGPYVGPGDIVTFTKWGGLRAYSAATIGQNVCTIKRASDSASQTFVSLTDGTLDIASITTFLVSTTGTVTELYDQVANSAYWNAGIGS